MTHQFRSDMQPHSSARAAQVLDMLADEMQRGAKVVRSFALMPIGDASLRLAMVDNPRLSTRINSRLFGDAGWKLPDQIDDFPQAEMLVALLQHGTSQIIRGLGFAWHGNRVARRLLSGDHDLARRVERNDLRRVLTLRAFGMADAEQPLPTDTVIESDGKLCLWCWMAALPTPIRTLGLAVLLKDCCTYSEYAVLTDIERAQRSVLTEAWLGSSLPALQGVT